jgi:hypothetical protein
MVNRLQVGKNFTADVTVLPSRQETIRRGKEIFKIHKQFSEKLASLRR